MCIRDSHDPKPWYELTEPLSNVLDKHFKWRANDRTSVGVENEYSSSVEGFVAALNNYFGNDEVRIFESNHLLSGETADENGWVGIYDETLAIMSKKSLVVIWTGYDQHYG